jgi:hypothetical protein
MASLVPLLHLQIYIQKVTGSNPVSPTIDTKTPRSPQNLSSEHHSDHLLQRSILDCCFMGKKPVRVEYYGHNLGKFLWLLKRRGAACEILSGLDSQVQWAYYQRQER